MLRPGPALVLLMLCCETSQEKQDRTRNSPHGRRFLSQRRSRFGRLDSSAGSATIQPMGFNRRKIEDELRAKADAPRRSPGARPMPRCLTMRSD